MAKTVLVTGANGFLGRNVAREFFSKGYKVFGIGHGDWGCDEYTNHGITDWCSADITLNSLVSFGVVPDVVVHCAGSGSVAFSMAEPYQDFDRTVSLTAVLLEYVRLHAPNAKVVYPSSAAVYGKAEKLPILESELTNPVSIYGTHKLIAEQLCRSYARNFNISVVVIRYFSVYGIGLCKQLLWDASQKVLNGEIDFHGTGEEFRDWLHVSDAARLAQRASEFASPSCLIVNGGSGVSVPVKNIIEELFACFDCKCMPMFTGVPRLGDPLGYVAENSLALQFGWKPEVGWKEGVRSYADWVKSGCP